MPNKIDLTGKIYETIYIDSQAPSHSGKTYWNCHCIICNIKKTIQGSHITSGMTKSCGCGHFLNKENNVESIEKICEICGEKFQITNSNSWSRKYCYNCSPSYTNENRAESLSQLRRAMKKEAIKRMGGACIKCGYNKSIAALHFHHKNPSEKDFGLAQNGIVHPWESYWAEVQKCELLCANCHAEVHEAWEQSKLKE